ncbi:hypothetical protein [Formosa algae]|uniref:Uncharacterized protein n=1 Tax=Formosa algae TaxID=225843 RepID=A0A9X0YJ80_9FLAO|nr:hypothetical protein [Formosa algae]MBP1838888.1 hypothetical protein [Formosa algae]MDQ0333665.1 hypothetical protein [Formosa algae]OEI78852.1 hypothetical protein AST99_16895 [Formosa algae]
MIYNIEEIILQTQLLMTEFSIPTRDTWIGLNGKNWDDYYANGNSYQSKRHYNIIIKEDGYADTKYERGYSIPNFECSAYNICTIRIPKRLEAVMHPIIHETVHFLQVNRPELDSQYIDYNGSNLYEYISQRPELEAHFVQLKYIERFELERLNHNKEVKENFRKAIKQVSEFNENAIQIIMYSKELGII